ncbi:MAG: sulfurtransferase TusA family protein [Candidatus Omnitrophica bacterium]|nr:sulfurtransferase TusA family protein [Candidatus Omnitrophota bacterium]
MDIRFNESLDLTGVACPMNFVKTKLKLEEMEKGKILEVILDEGEPIMNVPKSIKEEGHRILAIESFGDRFKLYVQKQ